MSNTTRQLCQSIRDGFLIGSSSSIADISGATRVHAIIADPIFHVRTPQVLNSWFKKHGLDDVIIPMHVSSDNLDSVVNGLKCVRNLGGFIVTVPHKTAVSQLCDELGATAQLVGAVNAVRRRKDGSLYGELYDGFGFLKGLCSCDRDPTGKSVLLLGAGGAAAAIAYSLLLGGVASLTIVNRSPDKAEALVERLLRRFPSCQISTGPTSVRGYDLIVNATTLGMYDNDPLPVDVEDLKPGQLVADVIMTPAITPLLQLARERGCDIHLGHHMLEAQAELLAKHICEV